MIVPINDHGSPLRENDLEIAEVAMAGADGDGAWGRRSSLQPSKHLLTLGSQRPAFLRYKAALTLCASNEFLDPRDPARGRGCRMKSRQPSRAPLSGLSTMTPVTAFENLLCGGALHPFLQQQAQGRHVGDRMGNRKLGPRVKSGLFERLHVFVDILPVGGVDLPDQAPASVSSVKNDFASAVGLEIPAHFMNANDLRQFPQFRVKPKPPNFFTQPHWIKD